MILNITNGDMAVAIMQKAGIEGDLLPWRDVLHAGPVPAGLDLAALSEVRAMFIADQGWAEAEAVRMGFQERDMQLRQFYRYEQVRLWFEHDLYDQLQLIQLLDWFSNQDMGSTGLSLICTDRYLGQQTPQTLASLQMFEQPVRQSQLKLASQAWQAYRQPDPRAWADLLQQDTRVLPFLEGAIRRSLQEYPGEHDGLSRTQRQMLQCLSRETMSPGKLFSQCQLLEERIFMGDLSFFDLLRPLIDNQPSAIGLLPEGLALDPANREQALWIKETGRALLMGQQSWWHLCPLDQWHGGVHLNQHSLWLWSESSGELVTP